MKTVINQDYIRNIVWEVHTTLNGLNVRAGFSPGYIYRLVPESSSQSPVDVSVSTVDKLHNAIEQLMIERGMNPPDDLWDRLVVHEEI